MRATLGLENDRLAWAVEALIDAERLVSGLLMQNDEQDRSATAKTTRYCFGFRGRRRSRFFPAWGRAAQPFLAQWQGLVTPECGAGPDGILRRIEQLVSYPAQADLWESEIFPARLKPYDLSQLDSIFQQSDLRWVGMPGKRVVFSFEADLDLLREEGA